MHDLVREFIRADIWRNASAGAVKLKHSLERATNVLEQRLQRWHDDTLEASFDDPDWRTTILNLLSVWLWRKEYKQDRQLVLEHWLTARYYRCDMAHQIERLISEITPPTDEWRKLRNIMCEPYGGKLYNLERRDYAALQTYIPNLQSHTQTVWFMLRGQAAEPASLWLTDDEDVQAVQTSSALHMKACEREPDWQPLRTKLACLHNSLGDYATYEQKQWHEAITYYDQALSFSDSDYAIYFGRAYVQHELKIYNLAIADYDRVIALNPEYTTAYNNRALAKYKLRQHEAAIFDYDCAIELNPEHATAYNNRGNVKDDLGQ